MHRPAQSMPFDTTSPDLHSQLSLDIDPISPCKGAKAHLKDIWLGFRNQHAAFVATCIYLIFEYNRPQQIYPFLDIIPWGKTILFLAIFLAFSDKTSKCPPSAAMLPMVGFSVCVGLSMLNAFSPSVAFNEWTMFFSWMFVVLLLTGVVTTRQRLFLFLVVYFLVNLKMAQHGFRSWALGGFGFSGWGVSGSPGWFQNSGEFCLEMVAFLPLVLVYIVFFRQDWSRGIRAFFYILAIMTIGSIIASNSRGGVVGLMVVGLWGLTYSRHRIKAFAILAAAASLIYLVMPPQFKARFENAGEDSTSTSRLAYWECGMQAIRDNPYTGIGFKNWTIWVTENHPELIGLNSAHKDAEVIHNTYLEVATELGLLGAAAYLAILLRIFLSNRRSARMARTLNDRFLEATAIGLNGCLIAYLVPSYFMSVLYYPYIWLLLALSVCASSICSQSEKDRLCKSLSR